MMPHKQGRQDMPQVIVADAGNGKFKVLVNYMQEGIAYSSKELAEAEAKKIRTKYEGVYKK